MNQHLESYTSGFYQVFDSKDFSRGIRKHVWIGKWRYDSALRNKDIDEETFNKALEEYTLNKEFHERERTKFLDTIKLWIVFLKFLVFRPQYLIIDLLKIEIFCINLANLSLHNFLDV